MNATTQPIDVTALNNINTVELYNAQYLLDQVSLILKALALKGAISHPIIKSISIDTDTAYDDNNYYTTYDVTDIQFNPDGFNTVGEVIDTAQAFENQLFKQYSKHSNYCFIFDKSCFEDCHTVSEAIERAHEIAVDDYEIRDELSGYMDEILFDALPETVSVETIDDLISRHLLHLSNSENKSEALNNLVASLFEGQKASV